MENPVEETQIAKVTVLQEIGCVLRWSKDRLIGMLWAYFDESGEHRKRNPADLLRLSFAGCIAPLENWNAFNAEWQSILDTYKVPYFHAVEFHQTKQGYKSTYYKWAPKKRQLFLDSLLKTMTDHISLFFGNKILSGMDKNFQVVYGQQVNGIVPLLAKYSEDFHHDKISFVFSETPEIPNQAIGAWCDTIKIDFPSIELAMMGNPKNLLPLQASDLFAYEVSHTRQWIDIGAMRPAMRHLQLHGKGIFVWPPN